MSIQIGSGCVYLYGANYPFGSFLKVSENQQPSSEDLFFKLITKALVSTAHLSGVPSERSWLNFYPVRERERERIQKLTNASANKRSFFALTNHLILYWFSLKQSIDFESLQAMKYWIIGFFKENVKQEIIRIVINTEGLHY